MGTEPDSREYDNNWLEGGEEEIIFYEENIDLVLCSASLVSGLEWS